MPFTFQYLPADPRMVAGAAQRSGYQEFLERRRQEYLQRQALRQEQMLRGQAEPQGQQYPDQGQYQEEELSDGRGGGGGRQMSRDQEREFQEQLALAQLAEERRQFNIKARESESERRQRAYDERMQRRALIGRDVYMSGVDMATNLAESQMGYASELQQAELQRQADMFDDEQRTERTRLTEGGQDRRQGVGHAHAVQMAADARKASAHEKRLEAARQDLNSQYTALIEEHRKGSLTEEQFNQSIDEINRQRESLDMLPVLDLPFVDRKQRKIDDVERYNQENPDSPVRGMVNDDGTITQTELPDALNPKVHDATIKMAQEQQAIKDKSTREDADYRHGLETKLQERLRLESEVDQYVTKLEEQRANALKQFTTETVSGGKTFNRKEYAEYMKEVESALARSYRIPADMRSVEWNPGSEAEMESRGNNPYVSGLPSVTLTEDGEPDIGPIASKLGRPGEIVSIYSPETGEILRVMRSDNWQRPDRNEIVERIRVVGTEREEKALLMNHTIKFGEKYVGPDGKIYVREE